MANRSNRSSSRSKEEKMPKKTPPDASSSQVPKQSQQDLGNSGPPNKEDQPKHRVPAKNPPSPNVASSQTTKHFQDAVSKVRNSPKAAKTSPSSSPRGNKALHRCYTGVLQDGCAYFFGEDRRNSKQPCYMKPFFDTIYNDDLLREDILKITAIVKKRSTEDVSLPFQFTITNNSLNTYKLSWLYLVRLPTEPGVPIPSDIRTKWGTNLVNFLNDIEKKRSVGASLFGPNAYAYSGDIGPPDGKISEAPYASDLFTLQETMDKIICPSLNNTDAAMISQERAILSKYYSPDVIPLAQSVFIPDLATYDRVKASTSASTDYSAFTSP